MESGAIFRTLEVRNAFKEGRGTAVDDRAAIVLVNVNININIQNVKKLQLNNNFNVQTLWGMLWGTLMLWGWEHYIDDEHYVRMNVVKEEGKRNINVSENECYVMF